MSLSEQSYMYTSNTVDEWADCMRNIQRAAAALEITVKKLQEDIEGYENSEKVSDTDIAAFIEHDDFKSACNMTVTRKLDRLKDDYSQVRLDKDFMEDWMSNHIEGHVNDQLDNLMCEKTQRTIEEYSLVTHDAIGELVSDQLYNCDYITEDSAREIGEELINEKVNSDYIAEEIGTALEDSEFVGQLVVKVVSKLIANAVISDVNVLSGVKSFIPALKDIKHEELGGCTD